MQYGVHGRLMYPIGYVPVKVRNQESIRQLGEARDRSCAAVDAKLRVRLFEVLGDGRGRDPQRSGNLDVRKSFGDAAEHLALAWCQVNVVRGSLAPVCARQHL